MSQAIHTYTGARAAPTERFYLPELDVLRFFAFLVVFIHHLPVPFANNFYDRPGVLGIIGSAGAFGVDLFFTLSGYLITRLLVREREETGNINMRAFYARRTLRIWPLYYFSLGLGFLLTLLPTSITSAPPLIREIFAPMKPSGYFFMAIFLYNFNFYGCVLTNPMSFMSILWTISLEEQFYLFWPWFVRYAPRKRIAIVAIVMIAVACIVRESLTFDLNRLIWNYTFARLDPFAAGILIALLPALNPRPALRLLLVLVGIASWIFAASYCRIPYQNGNLYVGLGYPAIALGSGAFVLAAIGAKSLRKNSAPVSFLVYLGKISYGLYVYDAIAIGTAALLLYRGAHGLFVASGLALSITLPVFILLAFGLNVALAAASYRWLEAPFLRLKERFTRVPSRAV